jgi:hypothetical protein
MMPNTVKGTGYVLVAIASSCGLSSITSDEQGGFITNSPAKWIAIYVNLKLAGSKKQNSCQKPLNTINAELKYKQP